ncbi:LIC_12616 family protein [Paenibacillus lactis]|uniref:phage neck terminator protein n=1 Tax=Paenibacillus lactis TaxID=228574 RepID=UPI0036C6318D
MIPFEQIRKVMIEGLTSHLGVPIIELDGRGETPPYPFMTYSFTDEGSPIGHMAVTAGGDQLIHFGTVSISVAFQSYTRTRLDSVELANRARDWFLTEGHWVLKDGAGAVVFDVGPSQNLDLQIGEEWERRNGFEVDLRAANVITAPLQPIDEVNLKGVDSHG